MRLAAFVARLQIRRRWRGLAVIALLVAVVGGIATSLIAGSRRSSSVVRRYFEATIPYDLQVGAHTLDRAQLLKIPGVVRADPSVYLAMTQVLPNGRLGPGVNGAVYARAGIDPTIRLLAGSIPDAGDTSAVGVNESFVKEFGLHAGDYLTVRVYAKRDLSDVVASRYGTPHGPVYRFRIAAVVRTPLDIALDDQRTVRGSQYGSVSAVLVPDRFYEANRKDFLVFADNYDVQLAPSTRRSMFEADVKRLTGGGDNAPVFNPARFAERRDSFGTPVGLETTALLALGIATALAGAIVAAMLLRAEQRAHELDAVQLRSIGASSNQLGAAAALRTAPFAAIGAASALGLALALSSRFPIGVGHLLEIKRGFDANLAVLAVATSTSFALVIALAFVLGRPRASRPTRSTYRRVGIDRILARNGAPTEIVIGAHLAFDRGDTKRGVPTRSAIAGGAIALAIVVALGVMVKGSDHLYASGAAHGWPWNAVIGNTNFTMTKAREAKLLADPRVAAATRARYGQADVGGLSAEVLAYDPRGDAPPAMLSGRLPRADDEIAPGAKLLHQLHAHVGGKIRLSVSGGEFEPQDGRRTVDRNLTVVGVSLPPVLGESEFGSVAVVPIAAIRAAGGVTDPQLVLARLRGRDVRATARALSRDYTPDIALDTVPSRVVNLHRVRTLPILGALLATVIGTVLLAYTLAVAVRARIRQLGVLRALGMTAGRVSRILTWQGVSLSLAIVVIGVPLGLVLGSIVWRLIADQLGVVPRPVVTGSIALVVPASIAIGIAASLLPAHRARRSSVAPLLRAE